MYEVDYEAVAAALMPLGLIPRGGFHTDDCDGISGRTLVLVGNAGPALWQVFQAERGGHDPLNDWCREVLTPLARDLGADILFPFDGPPYHPFITWAQRAEGISPSPIGPLIHPKFGLWHAYRAALLFGHEIAVPAPLDANPCLDCVEKPCLSSCPVDAFAADGYDVPACAAHLRRPQGEDCMETGCRARRACPVGQEYLYSPEQANFHMAAFLRNQ